MYHNKTERRSNGVPADPSSNAEGTNIGGLIAHRLISYSLRPTISQPETGKSMGAPRAHEHANEAASPELDLCKQKASNILGLIAWAERQPATSRKGAVDMVVPMDAMLLCAKAQAGFDQGRWG